MFVLYLVHQNCLLFKNFPVGICFYKNTIPTKVVKQKCKEFFKTAEVKSEDYIVTQIYSCSNKKNIIYWLLQEAQKNNYYLRERYGWKQPCSHYKLPVF